MSDTSFLNEEKYQKTKKKISKLSLIILIIGLLIGGGLIAFGATKQMQIESKYSEENRANLQAELDAEKANLLIKKAELEQIDDAATAAKEQELAAEIASERQQLETKKQELEAKGLNFDAFTKYTDGEAYDLKIITNVLDPGFDYCSFDEYSNNALTSAYCRALKARDDTNIAIDSILGQESSDLEVINKVLSTSNIDYCAFSEAQNNAYTAKYCSIKNRLDENFEFNKGMESSKYIPFYIFGAFIILVACAAATLIYMFTKRREIVAFQAQQIMPIAQEGIEKMAPTIGKAGANIAKEMAPAYGDIAKEISKGIKEGIHGSQSNSHPQPEDHRPKNNNSENNPPYPQ